MIRRLLLIVTGGLVYFSAIAISIADDMSSDDNGRMQIVNQELNAIEGTLDHQVPGTQELPIQSSAPQGSAMPQELAVPQEAASQNVSSASHIIPKKTQIDVSSELYSARIDEAGFSQKGSMSGYSVQYAHRLSTDPRSIINMFGLQGQMADGKFKAPAGEGTSGIKDRSFELKGIVGKDFYPSSNVRTTAYFGYGYRYLKNDENGLSYQFTDPSLSENITVLLYNRFSHYNYLPFGLDFAYQPASKFSLESNLEYDYMFFGDQVNKLGVYPGYSTVVLDQTGGYGIRASLRLNVYFKSFTAFAEGFYRYWNIPQSSSKVDPTNPANPAINEPRNNSEEFGVRLGAEI